MCVMNWEVGTDMHTRPRVKERASEDPPYTQGGQLALRPPSRVGWRRGTDVYVSTGLILLLVQ